MKDVPLTSLSVFLLVACLFLIPACTSSHKKGEAQEYTVEGTINGAAGKLVFLTDKKSHRYTNNAF